MIKKDTLILLTYGAYSEYGIEELCRVMLDTDIVTLHTEYMTLYPDQFNHYQFIEWLKSAGIIEPVKCYELWLGGGWRHDAEFSFTEIPE